MKNSSPGFDLDGDEAENMNRVGARWSLVLTVALVLAIWAAQFVFHSPAALPPLR